jgi:hypothetical protein
MGPQYHPAAAAARPGARAVGVTGTGRRSAPR